MDETWLWKMDGCIYFFNPRNVRDHYGKDVKVKFLTVSIGDGLSIEQSGEHIELLRAFNTPGSVCSVRLAGRISSSGELCHSSHTSLVLSS